MTKIDYEIDYVFNENEYLQEIKNTIDSTYNAH